MQVAEVEVGPREDVHLTITQAKVGQVHREGSRAGRGEAHHVIEIMFPFLTILSAATAAADKEDIKNGASSMPCMENSMRKLQTMSRETNRGR